MNRCKQTSKLSTRAIRSTFIILCLAFLPGRTVLAQETTGQDSGENQELEQNLEQYVGSYGPRHITFANGTLLYRRDGMPSSVSLKSLGDDSFEVIIPPGAMVQGPGGGNEIPTFVFNRSESGVVESLSLVTEDGSILATSKRAGAEL